MVYTCGENFYHQLGHQPPPPRLLAPAPVGGGRGPGGGKVAQAVGVGAGRYHSVYWTEESLYTWGLNAGQLGHLKVGLRQHLVRLRILNGEWSVNNVISRYPNTV